MITRRTAHKLLLGAGALSLTGIPAAHAQGQSQETLKVAVDALWANMAPINGLSKSSGRIFPNFYEKFTDYDYIADPSGGTIKPMLATSYERDGNVWTFKMREGVYFHNGVEMTAEDAAFTLSEERLART